jgi:hypothetical protein
MTNATLDSLTIDTDGWLINVHDQPLLEAVDVPIVGVYPREQQEADTAAVVRLMARIKRSGIDLTGEKAYYDFVTGPSGERFYTVRIGAPVNEPQPPTLTESVFAFA